MNVENPFFLIAGVIALLFSFGHAMWGRRMVLPDLQTADVPPFSKHMLLVIWDQPTVFHFLSALALMLASFEAQQALTRPLALFIGLVSFGFFLNYVVTSLLKNRAALAQIIPQATMLAIYLGIILAGMNK